MLGQVQIINGVKQIVPLASGNNDAPLGSVMAYYGTTDPADKNWLICDGRDTTGTDIELETHYPSLFMFLGGTNVLPDLRECTPVGVGQNGTDTIATHDVYTLGQFKDDQMQSHTHAMYTVSASLSGSGYSTIQGQNYNQGTRKTVSMSGRTGTTTHGKQKGVNWIIKATSTSDSYHLPTQEILQVEQYFDEGLSKAESYSTTETKTGGVWTDGKPIYRKVVTGSATVSAGGTTSLAPYSEFSNIGQLIKLEGFVHPSSTFWLPMNCSTERIFITDTTYHGLIYNSNAARTNVPYIIILEYTKTTD